MLQSSSPSLSSLSISQSILLLFLMPHYYWYNFYRSHFPNFCNLILELTLISAFFFFFLFNASVKWACGIFRYAFLTFLVSNSHIWSICSRVLSVRTGKSHKILQLSDSKSFSGLGIYHFSALLNPHFSDSFQ